MKKYCIIPFLLFIIIDSYSQDYFQAAGFRGGVTSGITYKKFLNEMKAMEAILSFRKGGIQITTIRQYHELTLYKYSDNIYFMRGFGGHLGFFYDKPNTFLKFSFLQNKDRVFAPVIGIDAYFGLEYRADQLPLVFGIDYKPFIEFSLLPFNMNIWDMAFYIKYIF